MPEINNGKIIDRIISILKKDETVAATISDFIFGELPEDANANAYPACFVTTAVQQERARNYRYPAPDTNTAPPRDTETEMWVIVVNGSNESTEVVQRSLYDIEVMIYEALKKNIHLLDSKGQDALAGSIELETIGRKPQQRGKIVDGMTIRVIIYNLIL